LVTRKELLSSIQRSGFDSFLAGFPDPVAVYALDGAFLAGNPVLLERGGYSRDQLDSLTFDDFLRSEDRPLILIEFDEARAGSTRRFDTAGVSPSGVAYRAQVTLIPVFEVEIPTAIIAIVHDLALLEDVWKSDAVMEQRYGEHLTTMSEALVLVRKDWVVLFMNPSAREMLSPHHESAVGPLLWDRIPLLQGSEFAIAARAAMTTRSSSVVRDYNTSLGVWREARFHPTSEGLAIYVRDVTVEQERIKRAAAVESQVAAQAALLDIAHDAIYVRGLDNVVTYWSRGATDIFGWTAEEMVGSDVREYIKHDADAWERATADALRDGQWSGQLTKESRDGRMLVLECRWTVVRDEHGNPESILAVNSDITVRKKQEDQLLRSQRMDSLGTLASGIAHDLNNVLTPIMLSTQLLLEGEDDPTRRELLTTIETGTSRGAEMLAQILTFGRGVDGRRAPVNIARLLSSVKRFSRDTLPGNIRVTQEVNADLWDVIGDETQLFQVLVNLVINARDAMPEGGDLTLGARNLTVGKLGFTSNALGPGRFVVIEVEDSGTGMSPETISKVFEPFFTTKGVGEGTGLGLSTSIEIVRGHGGHLQVYSELGNGSRFTLQLPADAVRAREEPSIVEQARPPAHTPRGHLETVLIVDDEAAIRITTRRALETYGYSPAVASNGAEAMDYIRSVDGAVAAVITDVTMPVMDGAALIVLLHEQYPRIPIIAASGLASNARVAQGPSSTHTTFIDKPYTATDLLRALRSALDAASGLPPSEGTAPHG
jgi:two-component system, cell cycle sensor histidine kinase and response regulator CckA